MQADRAKAEQSRPESNKRDEEESSRVGSRHTKGGASRGPDCVYTVLYTLYSIERAERRCSRAMSGAEECKRTAG